MNKYLRRYTLSLLLTLYFFPSYSQSNTFQDQFSKLYDFAITSKTNSNFKEFYEITIRQSVDHSKPKKKFNQRIFLGFQSFSAPTVIVTDGYSTDYASKAGYSNEIASELNANILVVEHRFFGESAPDTLDWTLLTVKQAADDYHYIKTIFDTLLTGNWLSTGISKGGQAALAYRMFYPNDVNATAVYGTAVKNRQTIITDSLLINLSQTPCGEKIYAFQLFAFKSKKNLLPRFNEIIAQRNFDFKPLDSETVLDYLLLELPYSFWQNGNKCSEIPDTSAIATELVDYIIRTVPPHFFSRTNRIRLEPAFYMFYHELGYYEYATDRFQNYLIRTSYSNKSFAPSNVSIEFDSTYQRTLGKFLNGPVAESIFFIYGQHDPWALQTTAKKNVYMVKDGSHKSRIKDLSEEHRMEIYKKVKKCLN